MKSFLNAFKTSVENDTLPVQRAPDSSESGGSLNVLELFQSQGCSSCPPTNANVLKFVDDPHLLVLTYDVTYWDRLGWKDTFGNLEFDQRQWEYARALQRRDVYTPQVVVNGQVEAVGNNAKGLQALLDSGNALSATGTTEIHYSEAAKIITISGSENQQGLVTVVRYDPKPQNVPILNGENGGRTLPHSNVVLKVKQIGVWNGGLQDFAFSKTDDIDGLKSAVLVSDGPGGPMLGAARI